MPRLSLRLRKAAIAVAAFAFGAFNAAGAHAAGDAETAALHADHHHWSFQGVFGTFDKASLQRGFKVYREICSGCHGLEHMAYRNLGQKGGPFFDPEYPNPNDNPFVKTIASEYSITDGPDEYGDPFDRPGKPSDAFVHPFPNENAARAANGGAYPVNLSLITKARHGGADYVRSLLLGYRDDVPEGFDVPIGKYYNPWFEGRLISMPPQLYEGIVSYDDGSAETPEQYAEDIAHFLMWAAEPKMEVRKKMGFMVIGYLFVFGGLTYWSYRKVWADVDH
ncbi:MAG: cytochrome c1 [Pseudomonadota bacterium]